MNIDVMYSSQSNEWATPAAVFEMLDREFHFTLDPACTHENAKCEKHYTAAEDGLSQDGGGETVFCNPPYGRAIARWVEKCAAEAQKPGTRVVLLIPARTDTKYFHKYICGKAELRFFAGRLHFNDGPLGAPFPSMLVVFPKKEDQDELTHIQRYCGYSALAQ